MKVQGGERVTAKTKWAEDLIPRREGNNTGSNRFSRTGSRFFGFSKIDTVAT
jgi:hypothetical protein